MVEEINKIKSFWKTLGPGLVTGAADDDPSGIATYSETGARFGFQFLWVSLFSFPLMAVVQEMCARIGLVTGRGLASNIRQLFPKGVLYVLTGMLLVANTFNIGADLGAMAQAVQLLVPSVSFIFLVVAFALISIYLEIKMPYQRYASYIKYLTFSLITYVITGFIVTIPWREVAFSTLVPHLTFSKEEVILLCGILGTTISPYLFFWQTSQEVEEELSLGESKEDQGRVEPVTSEEISLMKTDVWSGMFFSNLVMFFIIAVCSATLHTHGITSVKTAADAALALRPIAGQYAALLFSLGIIGTGMLAVPILAGSSAYALSESFKVTEGLNKTFSQAKFFYLVILFSIVVGALINFSGIDAMQALFYSAVLNGVVAPFMLFFIVYITMKESIMGAWKNSMLQNIVGYFSAAAMFFVGGYAVYAIFF